MAGGYAPVVAGSAEALERFERQTAWPMLVFSLAIIPLLVIPLVADLSPATETTLGRRAGCRSSGSRGGAFMNTGAGEHPQHGAQQQGQCRRP